MWEENSDRATDQGKAASDGPHQPVSVLSDIDRLVLRLHAEGHTTMGIALVTGYSERHVRRLTRRICVRLGACSVAQAVLVANDLGLFDERGNP
jgi:DNA-binding NarL/FixJ family response regulator